MENKMEKCKGVCGVDKCGTDCGGGGKTKAATVKMNGAQILMEELNYHGVTEIFGYLGGTVINIYDEIYKAEAKGTLKHYITAHEQGATHAADGYARASGKTGVAIATSGPGATNTVTGIATAYLDSIPMVIITGNVPTPLIGRDSFQEVDMVGITMPITKHNFIVKSTAELQETLRRAFYIANEGRKGPVLVDIPKDIQTAVVDYNRDAKFDFARVKKCRCENDFAAALKLIKDAKKPYIYVGGGAIAADASEQVVELSNRLKAPVGCSLMGLSVVPREHDMFLGLLGMHGRYASTKAQSECDLLIAVGARFSDRTTGNKDKFKSNCKVLQIDIDCAENDKNIMTDCYLEGDAKAILDKLLNKIQPSTDTTWYEHCKKLRWHEDNQSRMDRDEYSPYAIIKSTARHLPKGTSVATDVGQHQMWTAQYYPLSRPRQLLTSGGLGTMGFGMGAAIGASLVQGKKRVVLFTSDGSFHMNMQELVTAVSNEVPLLIILLDNNALGMVRQWQGLFFDKRYSQTILNRKTDYVKLVEAFGGAGYRVTNRQQFEAAIHAALKNNDRPSLIHCIVDGEENVLPMIPPNGSIEDIVIK
jgi:acetolactate synthase-1/2/3 large subunit